MPKQKLILTLMISSLLSLSAIAAVENQPSSDQTENRVRVTVTRGQQMSLEVLSSITDVSSARDEDGKAVKLTEKMYTVASFTRTTITVAPLEGGDVNLITLNIVNH